MTAINCLLLVLCWSQLQGFGSDAVQIYVDPAKSITKMVDVIHINCVADNLDQYVNGVNLIELSRNDQDPLVFIPSCGNVSFGGDSSRFQAVANIAKDPIQSYLNASLMNPVSGDTGIYTCSLYYIDESGHMKVEMASENLLIESIDVKSLERVLNQMGDKISSLVEENKKSLEIIASLGEKVTSLEEKNKNSPEVITSLGERVTYLEDENMKSSSIITNLVAEVSSLHKENKNLKEKAFYNAAFMATNNDLIKPRRNSVFILPDIVWSIGTGYNKQTGVFTAPVPGIYVFVVTIQTYDTSCGKEVNFMVNDEIMSRLYSYSSNTYPQNSISTVVNVKAGDRVYLYATDSCEVRNSRYTFFSGFLLKTV